MTGTCRTFTTDSTVENFETHLTQHRDVIDRVVICLGPYEAVAQAGLARPQLALFLLDTGKPNDGDIDLFHYLRYLFGWELFWLLAMVGGCLLSPAPLPSPRGSTNGLRLYGSQKPAN